MILVPKELSLSAIQNFFSPFLAPTGTSVLGAWHRTLHIHLVLGVIPCYAALCPFESHPTLLSPVPSLGLLRPHGRKGFFLWHKEVGRVLCQVKYVGTVARSSDLASQSVSPYSGHPDSKGAPKSGDPYLMSIITYRNGEGRKVAE